MSTDGRKDGRTNPLLYSPLTNVGGQKLCHRSSAFIILTDFDITSHKCLVQQYLKYLIQIQNFRSRVKVIDAILGKKTLSWF